ncbi:MAG: glycosyltransferase family 39 protein, partial [Planctomycetes bacterium]|nr:glycosyltransferase family 39 protein [Planctomycetota bacterium]
GRDFFAANGTRAFWYLTLARWACIPFRLIGGYICWRWAREMYGVVAGLSALMLWCFSPTVLAYGSLLTMDLPAAAMGVLAGYLFWKWLKEPGGWWAFWAGIGLGLAELTKFTWIILFGLWPLIWLVWRLTGVWKRASAEVRSEERKGSRDFNPSCTGTTESRPGTTDKSVVFNLQSGIDSRPSALQLAFILLSSLYLINLCYGLQGSFQKLGEYKFFSKTLAGEALRDRSNPSNAGNRFSGTLLGEIPVPLPERYLIGIDLQKHDFERGKPSYLRGEWRDHGWWYWYLYALAVKVPLGTWLLFLLAVIVRVTRPNPSALWRNELLLWLPAATVLALVSSQTGFSRYLRYALPLFPFWFIWISGVFARSVVSDRKSGGRQQNDEAMNNGRLTPESKSAFRTVWSFLRNRLVRIIATAALLCSVGSSLWVYPHSLSYFNELAGGPENGHWHLLDANIDWGQDLFYLKEWVEEHPEARPFYVNCFTICPLDHFGLDYPPPPADLPPGWYAISVHRLHHAHGKYDFFLRRKPLARAGYSIYIYRLKKRRE